MGWWRCGIGYVGVFVPFGGCPSPPSAWQLPRVVYGSAHDGSVGDEQVAQHQREASRHLGG